MASEFECPNCGAVHDVNENELYSLYEEDGAETLFVCPNCTARLTVSSEVVEWGFNAVEED